MRYAFTLLLNASPDFSHTIFAVFFLPMSCGTTPCTPCRCHFTTVSCTDGQRLWHAYHGTWKQPGMKNMALCGWFRGGRGVHFRFRRDPTVTETVDFMPACHRGQRQIKAPGQDAALFPTTPETISGDSGGAGRSKGCWNCVNNSTPYIHFIIYTVRIFPIT